jgi:hypothetical protein
MSAKKPTMAEKAPKKRRTAEKAPKKSTTVEKVPKKTTTVAKAPQSEKALTTQPARKKQKTSKGPKNPYARYSDFPWGPRDFNADKEFSGGRKVWGTSTNPHTKKIRDTQKQLLGPLLSWERAKDWRRQKINRALKAGIKEQEHATITGMPIGTQRNQLTDVQRGKFERLVHKTWEVMFIRKKAYILYKWYELTDEQKRFYLELGEDEELPDFRIPDGDLEEVGLRPVQEFAVVISVEPINRQAYARFEGPVERDTGPNAQDNALAIASRLLTQYEEVFDGGADDCLSDENVTDVTTVSTADLLSVYYVHRLIE